MRNEREHKCSACGGTGETGHASDCQREDGCRCDWWLCEVCAGACRISDVRTARDAIVDAETLRLYARQHRVTRYTGSYAFDVDYPLWTCQCDGCAPFATILAARAAFRAVPGLRGE